MKCPICKKEVPADSQYHPFCSERCKIIDLANWATEKYVISTPVEPEDLENDRLNGSEGSNEGSRSDEL
jgi:endogenous inhibitor of DNA gyrase (YacG/DUF329 family)